MRSIFLGVKVRVVMSGAVSRVFRPVVASWNWLRMAWSTQPVLFVSAVMGIAGEPPARQCMGNDL